MLVHGAEMTVSPGAERLFEGLRRPADVIAKWGAEIPPASRRSAVKELKLAGGRFFLKIYAYSGLWRLRTLFIQARARREYRNLRALAALGFDVPEAVAYGQERCLGFLSESFLLTRAIEGAVELRVLIDRPGEAPFPMPGPAERRGLIEAFARTLRGAHEKGFFLHTLRAKNLLLSKEAGGRYRLHVIDVPFAGIWRWRLFPGAGRVRDLALLMKGARQLLSRTERMRFARAYGAARPLLARAQTYQDRHYPGP
jgi:hypothetical protein